MQPKSYPLLLVAAGAAADDIAVLLDAEQLRYLTAPTLDSALALVRDWPVATIVVAQELSAPEAAAFVASLQLQSCAAPVVALAVDADRSRQEQLRAAGCADVLPLPGLDADRLARALRYATTLAAQARELSAVQDRLREVVSLSGESHWRMAARTPIPADLPADEQLALFYRHGYMVHADDAAAQALGRSCAQEVLGAPLADLFPPTEPQHVAALLQFIRAGYQLEAISRVDRGPHQAPAYVHIRWVGYVERGCLLHVAGTQKDISAQQMLESRLTELAAIVESSQQAIISAALDGTIRTWNRGAEQLFGWKAAEAIGQSILLIVPPATHQETVDIFADLTASAQVVSYDAVMRHRDGHAIDVALTIAPVYDAAGNLTGMATIGRDISDLKRAAMQLAESELRFRTVLEHSREAIYQLDMRTGQYDYASPSFEEVLGYTAAEIASNNFALLVELLHPADVPRLLLEVPPPHGAPGSQQDNRFEYRFHTRHRGWRWITNSVRTLYDETGQAYLSVGSILDVTERRAMFEQVQESEQRMLQAQQIAHLGSWDSDIATQTTHLSDELCRICGITPTAAPMHFNQVLERIYPVDLPLAHQFIYELSTRSIATADLRIQRPDGELRFVSLQGKGISSADGELERVVGTVLDITERKQAQDALRESETNLRAIFDSSSQGITLLDRDYRIKAFNRRAAMGASFLFGREMLIGQSILDYQNPEETETFKEFFAQALAGVPQLAVVPMTSRDGTIWWELTFYPVTEEDETISGVVLSASDITERKQAQDALERSERLYHTLARNFPNGNVYLIDTAGKFLLAEGQGMAQIGLAPERVRGRTVDEVFGSSPTFDEIRRAFGEAAGTTPTEGEISFRGRWRAVHTVPIRDERGAVVAVMAMTQDITERRQAEEELRRSEARLKDAQRIAHVGNWEWSSLTLASTWSEEMYRIFDLAPDAADLTLENLFRYVHPDDAATAQEIMARALRTEPIDVEIRIVRPSGAVRYVAIRSETIVGADGRADRLVGTALDITERKEAEIKLQHAHDELDQRVQERTLELRAAKDEAERANAAKSEFLSRMSHELRTPLNSILGFAQIMEMDILSERQAGRVGYIMKAGQHLLRLINEVLDLSRVESGRLDVSPEPVLLARTVETVGELIAPQLQQRGQQLVVAGLESAPMFVQADQQRLAQVLLNLLSNASKYSGAGSTITVGCELGPGGLARISVADTGPGIAAQHLARLFLPFERLAAASTTIEGTGLGLALSKRLVELMGGTIGVESELDRGSRFWIELPLASRPAELIGGQLPELSAELLEQPHTVLYVEDNLANLEVIEHVFAAQPQIQLLSTMQGQLGLDLAVQHRPSLILLDYHLPDLPGHLVLQRLRQHPVTRDIPVIMISADATPNQMRRAITAGATEYLTKPLDVRLFMTRVMELLRSAAPQPS